uniref:Uncharacterized protein n=1 Tax=Arundo donax TaxID=35708 RepID=A0A0A8Z3P9_ARUDO
MPTASDLRSQTTRLLHSCCSKLTPGQQLSWTTVGSPSRDHYDGDFRQTWMVV